MLTDYLSYDKRTNIEHSSIESGLVSSFPIEYCHLHDVRGIANFVLDQADELGIDVTNMALNKIVYFMHCDFLVEKRTPLVGAKIEAWQHGPVFRELYHEFKQWHDSPIRSRANKVDPYSGDVIKAQLNIEERERLLFIAILRRYVAFSASQLRALSHRAGGPWAKVWGHDGNANVGMKIDNELILELYKPEVLQ